MAKVAVHSRLRLSRAEVIDGFEYWSLLEFPEIPEQPDDILYRVRQYDRIDTIAYDFYGDAVLWPVVAVANGLEIVPSSLNENMELRIPAPRYILQVFFGRFANF